MNRPALSSIIILGMCGSLRLESFTRRAVDVALEGAQEMGAQTRQLDLNNYDLKFADIHTEPTPGVLRLRQDVRLAQGLILGTPEYHSSFSGILKHALDLMGFPEFEGKMVGLVGVAGGKLGAINALNSLRTVGRSMHAWVVPEQVSIQRWGGPDERGRPVDPKLERS
jgi:NAD(P)H-dependent FMN reductase